MFQRATFLIPAALFLLLPGATAAQHLRGPAADPSNAFEAFGTVTDFTTTYGSGMPTLIVEDSALGTVAVALGPLWYLQQQRFSAAPGDQVELLAYPCATCSAPAVAAWASNRTTDAFIELRNAQGYPLWIHYGGTRGANPLCGMVDSMKPGAKSGHDPHGGDGPGQGDPHGPDDGPGGDHGPGPGHSDDHEPGEGPGGDHGPNPEHGRQCDWTAPDMGSVATVSGMVISVAAAPGNPMASMVLTTGDDELELLLNPYHPIAAAGFLIEPEMHLVVTYAPWAIAGEAVLATISITDPVTGVTLQLRDPETGYPVHG